MKYPINLNLREKLRRPLLSRSKGMTQKPKDRRKAAMEIEALQVSEIMT